MKELQDANAFIESIRSAGDIRVQEANKALAKAQSTINNMQQTLSKTLEHSAKDRDTFSEEKAIYIARIEALEQRVKAHEESLREAELQRVKEAKSMQITQDLSGAMLASVQREMRNFFSQMQSGSSPAPL